MKKTRILFSILTLLALNSNANIDQVSFTATSVCDGSQTTLASTSTVSGGATIISWNWDFDGDFQFDDASGPSVTAQLPFTGQPYNIGLQIITDMDPVGASAYQIVTVNPVPSANFAAPDVCEGSATALADQSSIASGSITTWEWDLDDDGTYDDATGSVIANDFIGAGVYTVGLQVTSDQGCQATTSESVTVDPTPIVAFEDTLQCLGDITEFTAVTTVSSGQVVSYAWELNGNNLFDDASGSMITNQFSADGDYQIGLQVESDQGCVNDTFQLVTIAPFPFVGFFANDACENEEIQFTNITNNVVGTIDYEWSFGLQGGSIEDNPTFQFISPGSSEVRLIGTTSFGCADTMTQTIEVYPAPIADFTFTEVCIGNQTFFNDTTDPKGGTIQGYEWNFGDLNTAIGSQPIHSYIAPDSYLVTMVVLTTDGCRDTVEHFVNVWSLPEPDITANGPVNFCLGGEVDLSVNPLGSPTVWSTGETTQTITVDTTNTYEVLIVDENGCQGGTQIDVLSRLPPVLTISGDVTISLGENVDLSVSGANEYTWSPSTFLDNADISDPTSIDPNENITYSVVGTDLNGCQSEASVNIIVNTDYNLQPVTLFTPNGDDANENFFVANIDSYTDCVLRVYNRWGLEVFSDNAYQNDWTGQDFNGDNLPDGTYYFVIECDGREDRFDGAVTILR